MRGADLVGVVGWGRAALQVGHLGVILRDDQRPLKLHNRPADPSVDIQQQLRRHVLAINEQEDGTTLIANCACHCSGGRCPYSCCRTPLPL